MAMGTESLFAKQRFQPQQDLGSTFTVTVIPCGREDMSTCGPEELPYEISLPRFLPTVAPSGISSNPMDSCNPEHQKSERKPGGPLQIQTTH